MTYREVGVRYGVAPDAVRNRVTENAKRAGEWPLPNGWKAKQARGMDRRRKLPSYELLCRMHVNDGWTYAEIGKHYGVTRGWIHHHLRAQTLARGLTWPLDVDHAARRRVNTQRFNSGKDHRIRAIGVIWVVDDYLMETGISAVQLCLRAGVQPQYIHSARSRLRNNLDASMDVDVARRLMMSINETLVLPRHMRAA